MDEPFTVSSDTDLESGGPQVPISGQQSQDLVLLPPPTTDLDNNQDELLLVPPPPSSDKDFGGGGSVVPGPDDPNAGGGGAPTVKIDIRAPPDLDLRLDGSGDVYAESDSRYA